MQPIILAIESSCDETSAAIINNGKVLNNVIASQTVHQKYGGVVPELASRAHQLNIYQVVNECFTSAGVLPNQINAVAFTRGPGLMGALLVGASFAKGLAWSLNIPLIEVNHMEAHILAHFIDDPRPEFPFLCLTVSGGHTQIVLVRDHLHMEVLGETKDDAVGEAFDKAAKILGLPYPGGPLIDQYARKGNPKAFPFPITSVPDLDFSFSGIKTAFLYFIRDHTRAEAAFVENNLPDICASYQHALIQMLLNKLGEAVHRTGIKRVAIAGGVSANSYLRKALEAARVEKGWQTFIPEFQYCTDNAGMIAMAAHYKYVKGIFTNLAAAPQPNLAIVS